MTNPTPYEGHDNPDTDDGTAHGESANPDEPGVIDPDLAPDPTNEPADPLGDFGIPDPEPEPEPEPDEEEPVDHDSESDGDYPETVEVGHDPDASADLGRQEEERHPHDD